MNTSNAINGCLKLRKTNNQIVLSALLVLLASIFCQSALGQQLVTLASSHFDGTNVTDGWQGTNNAKLDWHAGGATSNSVGYISVSQSAGDGLEMFFVAPPKYLGDQHAAYNGFLVFNLKRSPATSLYIPDPFVLLSSTNLVLRYYPYFVPGTNWQSFELPINENAGWFNATSNRPATKEDFQVVLKNLTKFWIAGEYSSQSFDETDLDDVQLLGQPTGPVQPALALAMYAGITINAQVGASYRIEYQNTLAAGTNWLKLADVVFPYTPYLFIDQTSPSASSRFYRAVLNP